MINSLFKTVKFQKGIDKSTYENISRCEGSIGHFRNIPADSHAVSGHHPLVVVFHYDVTMKVT